MRDSMDKLLNFIYSIAKIIWRPADLPTKIGTIIFISGITLLSGGVIFRVVYKENIFEYAPSDASFYSWLVGLVVVAIGLLILVCRVITVMKNESVKDIGFIYVPAFKNMSAELDITKQGLPPTNLKKLMSPLKRNPFDSRDKHESIDQLKRIKQYIEDNSDVSRAQKAYVKSVGAIPFLFHLGTVFRDNHLQTEFVANDRATGNGYLLNKEKFQCRYFTLTFNNQTDLEIAISAMQLSGTDEAAIAVSFTQDILASHLPAEFSNSTLFINSNIKDFELIQNNEKLDEVIGVISKCISRLNAHVKVVNLFICAQTSVVFKLGERYQIGMHGYIKVHHYCSTENRYIWGIETKEIA